MTVKEGIREGLGFFSAMSMASLVCAVEFVESSLRETKFPVFSIKKFILKTVTIPKADIIYHSATI